MWSTITVFPRQRLLWCDVHIKLHCSLKKVYLSKVRFENATYLELQQIPYLGIGPEHKTQDSKLNKGRVVTEKLRHHAYYQWVPFVLFVQGLFFYFPHKLWKSWEGGKIKKLVEGLQKILVTKNLENTAGVKINNNLTVPSEAMIQKQVGWWSTEAQIFFKKIELSDKNRENLFHVKHQSQS